MVRFYSNIQGNSQGVLLMSLILLSSSWSRQQHQTCPTIRHLRGKLPLMASARVVLLLQDEQPREYKLLPDVLSLKFC
jgi:hypothetical protein